MPYCTKPAALSCSSLSLRRGGISAALKNWFLFVLARLLSSLGLLPPSAEFLGILQLFSIMGACNLCSLLLFHTMCRPVPLWSDGWLFPKVCIYFCFHGCDIFSPKLFSTTLRFRALCRSFMAISVMHLTNWETKLWMFLMVHGSFLVLWNPEGSVEVEINKFNWGDWLSALIISVLSILPYISALRMGYCMSLQRKTALLPVLKWASQLRVSTHCFSVLLSRISTKSMCILQCSRNKVKKIWWKSPWAMNSHYLQGHSTHKMLLCL